MLEISAGNIGECLQLNRGEYGLGQDIRPGRGTGCKLAIFCDSNSRLLNLSLLAAGAALRSATGILMGS
jgi:hypothetical protein